MNPFPPFRVIQVQFSQRVSNEMKKNSSMYTFCERKCGVGCIRVRYSQYFFFNFCLRTENVLKNWDSTCKEFYNFLYCNQPNYLTRFLPYQERLQIMTFFSLKSQFCEHPKFRASRETVYDIPLFWRFDNRNGDVVNRFLGIYQYFSRNGST